jgi:hypothetical protein
MNTIKRLGIFTGALLLLATGSFAIVVTPQKGIPGQWQLIGSIPVGREPSRDSLTLQGFHTDFQSLRMSVTGSTVHLNGVVITFGDGTTANIEVRADIQPGTQSGPFALPGGRHDIQSIDFWHQSVGQFHGAAVVSVFGQK